MQFINKLVYNTYLLDEISRRGEKLLKSMNMIMYIDNENSLF